MVSEEIRSTGAHRFHGILDCSDRVITITGVCELCLLSEWIISIPVMPGNSRSVKMNPRRPPASAIFAVPAFRTFKTGAA